MVTCMEHCEAASQIADDGGFDGCAEGPGETQEEATTTSTTPGEGEGADTGWSFCNRCEGTHVDQWMMVECSERQSRIHLRPGEVAQMQNTQGVREIRIKVLYGDDSRICGVDGHNFSIINDWEQSYFSAT